MDIIDVDTTTGTVRGELGGGIAAFKGIPYAEPPFGSNLFQPPVPRTPWSDVRDCTAYGPACPQPAGPTGSAASGEDCLTLNIWTPENAADRPVMFWIHGGAYIYGSNADPGFGGGAFARDGVVMVSCNYRLGALGFLHAGHLDDAYATASGAYGLADQIAALRWVRENIAAFGGDPDNVTIFGCSAGGTFVTELLGCPSAQGLFNRVISQSAGGSPLFDFAATIAEPVAELMLAKLGGTPADLPKVDPARIVDAQVELLAEIQRGEHPACGEMTIPFVPLIGGDLMPRSAHDAVAAGIGADVPLVIGTNRDENSTFELMAEVTGSNGGVAAAPWGADAALQQRIRAVYDRTQEPGSPIGQATAISSDRLFRIPSLRVAEAHHRAGGVTRVYQYAWRSPAMGGRVGAGHGMECPFVFDDFSAAMLTTMLGDAVPTALAGEMHGAWISFAATGDPAATGAIPQWPEYDLGHRPTMVFGEKTALVDDPDGERRTSWDEVALDL